MKKFLIFLTILVTITVFFICPISAQNKAEKIEYFEDGSYCVTVITKDADSILSRAISTTSGTKTENYYSATNTKLFSLSVRGTFNYNGTVARSTSSSYSYGINHSSWSFVSGSSSYSANYATATGTFRNIVTKTLSTTLYCDQDGNLY